MLKLLIFCQVFIIYFCSKIVKDDFRYNLLELFLVFLAAIMSTILFPFTGVYIIILILICHILFHYYLSRDILDSIFSVFLGYSGAVIANHLFTVIESFFIETSEENLLILLIGWFFLSILFSFVILYIRRFIIVKLSIEMVRSIKPFATFLVSFTAIVFIISIIFEVELGNTFDLVKTNFIFFIIYSLLTGVILFVYMRINRQHQKIKEKHIEFQALQNYTQSIEQSYNTLRKFRHDYKNMMISLDALLEEGNLEAIQKFIKQDLQGEANKLLATRNNLDDLSNLNISPLKGLILAKLWQVDSQKIEVKLEINQAINHIKMEPIDCVKVVGILLDNAIEAVQEMGTGQIRLTCFQLQHSVHLVIDNTYQGDLVPTKQLFQPGYSTKGKQRGLGLANARELIAQYPAASLETQIKGQIFSQHLTIPA